MIWRVCHLWAVHRRGGLGGDLRTSGSLALEALFTFPDLIFLASSRLP